MNVSSKKSNVRKFQAVSANVFFPAMFVFLYLEGAYIVLTIYCVFGLWYLFSEVSIYCKLIESHQRGKQYVIESAVLAVANGILAFLSKVGAHDYFTMMCIVSLVYSAWFGYFKSQKIYDLNSHVINAHFDK